MTAPQPSKLEMFVRRTIVIAAVLLALTIAWLMRGRIAISEDARDASFFDNASAIQGAFRKALGPHPPVIELVIEPHRCTANVVVGSEATQKFTLDSGSGFVVAGEAGAFPERNDIAFSMSTVPFPDVPAIVANGSKGMEGPLQKLVVDRPPGAKKLRYRAFGAGGKETVIEPSVP